MDGAGMMPAGLLPLKMYGGNAIRFIWHACPDCKAETTFVRGRSGITQDGTYFAVKEYACPVCGLHHEESAS
jgi:hypothetical protein